MKTRKRAPKKTAQPCPLADGGYGDGLHAHRSVVDRIGSGDHAGRLRRPGEAHRAAVDMERNDGYGQGDTDYIRVG